MTLCNRRLEQRYIALGGVTITDSETATVVQVSQHGLLNANGQADYLRNCDFAYDPTRNRYYMTRDSNAANPLSETEVLSVDANNLTGGTWRWEASIPSTRAGSNVTVFANNGFERDWYGNLTSSTTPVVFSSGRTSAGLFSYNEYMTPVTVPAG